MIASVTVSIFLLLLSVWILWRKHKLSHFKRLGIPGPPPSFLFGNIWEIHSKNTLSCYRDWVKKYGTVIGYYLGLNPVLLVADPEILKLIQVRDFHSFINRSVTVFDTKTVPPKLDSTLLRLKGKRWKEVRSTITPFFTGSKMKMIFPIMISTVDDFLENIKEKAGNPFDIVSMFQKLTLDAIGRAAFGVQTEVQRNPEDPFIKNMRFLNRGNVSSMLTVLTASFPEISWLTLKMRTLKLIINSDELKNPKAALLDICDKVIMSRRQNPKNFRPDLLQLMLTSKVREDGGKATAEELTAGVENVESLKKIREENGSVKESRNLTDDEIKSNTLVFLFAGFETTSITLGFVAHLLVKYPHIQEAIREELQRTLNSQTELDYTSLQQMTYLDQVISETLRLYPPVHSAHRQVEEDVQVGNMKITKGTSIHIPIYLLHHNPEFFEDPETFNTDRFSQDNNSKMNLLAYQPFGAGPRNCIGMRFAQLEVKLTIAKLLQKYRLVACDGTEKVKSRLLTRFNTIGLTEIILRADPL